MLESSCAYAHASPGWSLGHPLCHGSPIRCPSFGPGGSRGDGLGWLPVRARMTLSGIGPIVAATVIGKARDITRFPDRDHFAAYDGTAPIEVSSGSRKGLPAVPARQPADRPRHPHGRRHPGQPPAQRGPRLLRQETGRGQDPERSPAFPETPGRQRRLRLPAGRCPARRGPRGGSGRADGERLSTRRGRLAPRTPALRESHSRVPCPPTAAAAEPEPAGTPGLSPAAASSPPSAMPRVQVERPQRSEDERPGRAARRRPHPAARKATKKLGPAP